MPSCLTTLSIGLTWLVGLLNSAEDLALGMNADARCWVMS